MQAGGKAMLDIASATANQAQAHADVGKVVPQQILAIGKEGGKTTTPEGFSDDMSLLERSSEIAQIAVTPLASLYRAITSGPNANLPSEDISVISWMSERFNNAFQRE
jgi:hypothetical protein